MVERQLPSSRAFASALPRTRSATSVASAPYGVRRNPFQTQLSRSRAISASARMRYDYDDDDNDEEQDGFDDEDESLDIDSDEDDESYEQQRYCFHNRHRFLHGFRSHAEFGKAHSIERAFPPHHQHDLEVKRPSSETDDIVVRDEHGEIELEDPPTPPPPEMDEASRAALEARHENELERQRLAEAVKQHQLDQNSMLAQAEEELLEAVKASLRQKVAALAEDNWMFEREELPHHQ